MPMVEIKGLKKFYGERTVLDIDDLMVNDGEVLALAGANGSGKTTLLKILAGLIKPDEGTFAVPERILFMPQQSYAFRGSLEKNILIGLRNGSTDELLEKTGLLHLKGKKASSLSGGELQRLAFCRVIVREADLLLLDEPTSACDAEGTKLILSALKEYSKKTGCTVIMSTHSSDVALEAADRLLILSSGKPLVSGTPEAVIAGGNTIWTKPIVTEIE